MKLTRAVKGDNWIDGVTFHDIFVVPSNITTVTSYDSQSNLGLSDASLVRINGEEMLVVGLPETIVDDAQKEILSYALTNNNDLVLPRTCEADTQPGNNKC